MNNISGIYKIICTSNNKFYIGSSVDISRRFKDHTRALNENRHTNKYLQEAWNKYGKENFEFEIIENIDIIDQLPLREKLYIDDTNCCNRKIGFNISSSPHFLNSGKKLIDLTGQRFGRLVVIELSIKDKYSHFSWLCLCDCGNKTIVAGNNLKTGSTKSCGCYRRENGKRTLRHGYAKSGKRSREYCAWVGMNRRCDNRKIKICYKWSSKNLKGFENFLEDMGKCADGFSLYKINNKRYSKRNCKWATHKEQNRNKSNNIFINISDENLCLQECFDKYHISSTAFYYRLKKYNKSREETIKELIKEKSNEK